ncbi:hydroxymyristoyl-ACP dehydratase [Legionella londiniensis]|uniref:3-hydroxymyristoyl-ACP dehydratase n=1 Tax=Legionella londiniensis TaxID=45068 RepID=A0A0W0VT33_9GAMM|nr:hydroxymyristoyl-ACP dehydratase [Legionella londiniensis]KTD23307.1 3-hydroxymyristoyl-ACP dehydratase [Legionella londiniensis]STX94138.1 3-hydroxymyristoyl-ACP dehydratase [Legionella londiniensis]
MRFLFVDRILQLSPTIARGIKHVTREDYYLCADDDGRPCFIPSLIGETLGQLAAWHVMASQEFSCRPVAGVVSSACLYRPAYIGETIQLEAAIDAVDDAVVRYHGTASIGQEIIFRIDSALGPLLPMNEFIDKEAVRQQFNEINRPADWPLAQSLFEQGSGVVANEGLHLIQMQFDHILHCEPHVSIRAEKRVTRAAAYFPDHFPKKPVLPLTVLLECKLNLAREFLARSGLAGRYVVREMRRIKMSGFVHPGDVLQCEMTVKSQSEQEMVLNYHTEINRKRVCILDVVLVLKGGSHE